MKTEIEVRFPSAGFVYTKNTRMLFSPKHCWTRKDADKADDMIVLGAASNWPPPNKRDVTACIGTLRREYPDRPIGVDTDEGIIIVAC